MKTDTNMAVIQYQDKDRHLTALVVAQGRTLAKLIWIDTPVSIHKVPLEDVTRYGKAIDYPARKAGKRMLEAGRRLGITKSAKAKLREVAK